MRDVNPNQFAMFMTPREIQEKYRPLEGDRHELVVGEPGDLTVRKETDDEVWSRKYREADTNKRYADESGGHLTDSIRREGVRDPVWLQTSDFVTSEARYQLRSPERHGEKWNAPQVLGGHHRVAAAAVERPDDLIPVLHDYTFRHAWAGSNLRKGAYPYS